MDGDVQGRSLLYKQVVGYPFDHFPPKEVLWTYFPSIYKPTLLVLVTFLMLDFFFYFFWNTGPFGVSNV